MVKTILVLAANPKGTPQVRLDQEVREIDNGLRRALNRDEFSLKQEWAARSVDVRRAMLDYKPNIVHFCGHGTGENGIAFEDENGQTKLVDANALAGFFKLFADTVECVVLNACYSDVQAEAIANHIPYVIGMNKAIGDIAAIDFAVAFYDALGAGKHIEFAYKLACNAIQWAGLAEDLTPVLHLPQGPVQGVNMTPVLNPPYGDIHSVSSEISGIRIYCDKPTRIDLGVYPTCDVRWGQPLQSKSFQLSWEQSTMIPLKPQKEYFIAVSIYGGMFGSAGIVIPHGVPGAANIKCIVQNDQVHQLFYKPPALEGNWYSSRGELVLIS